MFSKSWFTCVALLNLLACWEVLFDMSSNVAFTCILIYYWTYCMPPSVFLELDNKINEINSYFLATHYWKKLWLSILYEAGKYKFQVLSLNKYSLDQPHLKPIKANPIEYDSGCSWLDLPARDLGELVPLASSSEPKPRNCSSCRKREKRCLSKSYSENKRGSKFINNLFYMASAGREATNGNTSHKAQKTAWICLGLWNSPECL